MNRTRAWIMQSWIAKPALRVRLCSGYDRYAASVVSARTTVLGVEIIQTGARSHSPLREICFLRTTNQIAKRINHLRYDFNMAQLTKLGSGFQLGIVYELSRYIFWRWSLRPRMCLTPLIGSSSLPKLAITCVALTCCCRVSWKFRDRKMHTEIRSRIGHVVVAVMLPGVKVGVPLEFSPNSFAMISHFVLFPTQV